LLTNGWSVKILDNLSHGRVENLSVKRFGESFAMITADLKDRRTLSDAVRGVEVVFHFAANPEVKLSTVDPQLHFNENVLTTFNLLEALRIAGNVRYLVFASSSSVYGEPDKNPVTEDARSRPVSVYGATKASSEMLIMAYSKLYAIRSISLRYANIVGPRLRHGVIYDFARKLRNNPYELEILGDGNQKRSFLWVEDAIDATLRVLSLAKGHFDVCNVGNEDWISVRDVAQELVNVAGLKGTRFVYKPVLHGVGWMGDVKEIRLHIGKAQQTGWVPSLDSRESVRRTAKSTLQDIGAI
jgi:UDP-glucose 4-epimerase